MTQGESGKAPDGICHACFPFQAPFAKSSNHNHDPIGSPMPETPIHARRKQHAIEGAILEETTGSKGKPVFSSKYSGLEKEVETSEHGNSNMAQIHEGKVRRYSTKTTSRTATTWNAFLATLCT